MTGNGSATPRRIMLYDTTLRDGTQGANISLTVDDKVQIALLLDDIGVDYIEGGWPLSNPKDLAFFQAVRGRLRHARLAAFGSTARRGRPAEADANLRAILETGAPVACIFGKASRFQAERILGQDPEAYLGVVESSVRFLKRAGLEVVFDAEHYFDGFKADPGYALDVVRAAEAGGADWVALCDTNGGSLPEEVEAATRAAAAAVQVRLGIHAHNDGGLAVANSLAALRAGADMVQGTVNGYGERCGNANWVTIWPTVVAKLGLAMGRPEALSRLTTFSRTVAEIANMAPNPSDPYVGENAFTHKAGVHASAVRKQPEAYEHIDPGLVGNDRRILVSELAGRSNLLARFPELAERADETARLVEAIKEREHRGFQFDAAEASVALLVREVLGERLEYYRPLHYHVWVSGVQAPGVEATVRVQVGDQEVLEAALGDGPVHALDGALRKALGRFYPALHERRLTEYKVRVLDGREGTAATVRVLVSSRLRDRTIRTVGVSPNILEASWQALRDAVDYALHVTGTPVLGKAPAEAARS